MADLEQFRTDTRDWLKKNAPAEMFTPPKSQDEILLGRHARRPTPARHALARGHGRARLDGADVAEGVRRRRALEAGEPRSSRRRWRSSTSVRRSSASVSR